MHKREYKDTDGRCFALMNGECGVMVLRHEACGSYECPFYKPSECKDWVRIETQSNVLMYAPEDYVNEKKNKQPR